MLIANALNRWSRGADSFAQQFRCPPEAGCPGELTFCRDHTGECFLVKGNATFVASFPGDCQALLVKGTRRCIVSLVCLYLP